MCSFCQRFLGTHKAVVWSPQTAFFSRWPLQGHDKTPSRQSSPSLDLDNDGYMSSDNQTDTIQLSDLKAPTIGCSCFHLPRINLHKKRVRRFSESPSELSLDIIQNGVSANKQVRSSVPKRENDEVHETAWSDGCVFGNQAESTSELTEEASQVTALKLTVPDSKSRGNIPKQTKRQLKLCAPCTMENKFNASVQIRKAKKLFSVFCWAVLTTALLSISMTIWILCGTQSYVFVHLPNDTTSTSQQYFVRPPSFLTQFATSWTLLLYPIYLVCNVILRFEKASSSELLLNHMVILASDQPTIVKVLTRCILLSILWQLFLNCFLRSMEVVSPIDCAAIMAVLPCFHYLFSWIIVHRRFCALRVIAFILASSGVIFNIYSDQYSMWYKCLSSVAVVAFALFHVTLKRIASRPTFAQFAAFSFGFVYRLLWTQQPIQLDNVWITSLVLIALASVLNALPNKLLKATARAIKRSRSPKATGPTGKRNRLTTGSTPQPTSLTNPRVSVPTSSVSGGSRPGSAGILPPNTTSGSFSKTRSRFSSVLLKSASASTAAEV
ncbi:solute carrier family 35 member F4 [Clonorchis sinensis]|uniref:Solute carrier family 35 member F4 n=1 Tax=Clonorchis sinensis TaxID=79923 RepID=G7YWB7_CLOSI|nr:solute carrier family 35 member F4 [Clonorchis sinensis]